MRRFKQTILNLIASNAQAIMLERPGAISQGNQFGFTVRVRLGGDDWYREKRFLKRTKVNNSCHKVITIKATQSNCMNYWCLKMKFIRIIQDSWCSIYTQNVLNSFILLLETIFMKVFASFKPKLYMYF